MGASWSGTSCVRGWFRLCACRLTELSTQKWPFSTAARKQRYRQAWMILRPRWTESIHDSIARADSVPVPAGSVRRDRVSVCRLASRGSFAQSAVEILTTDAAARSPYALVCFLAASVANPFCRHGLGAHCWDGALPLVFDAGSVVLRRDSNSAQKIKHVGCVGLLFRIVDVHVQSRLGRLATGLL